MRYPPDQKEKARQALLQSSAAMLRKHGFHNVGVDSLAASAGVTSGAFYSNFAGKEVLLQEVIRAELGEPFFNAESGSLTERRAKLRKYLSEYISAEHRDAPETGCVIPTLSADVARVGAPIRQVYRERMVAFMAKIAKLLNGTPAEREAKAWEILTTMVGAISIARAFPDGPEANEVLRAALASAIARIDQIARNPQT